MLTAKRGLSTRFKSKGERDKWLRSEIKSIGEATDAKEKMKMDISTDIDTLMGLKKTLERDIANLIENFEQSKTDIVKIEEAIRLHRQERNQAIDSRK